MRSGMTRGIYKMEAQEELNLCSKHKQEWKRSEYDSHNCDYCKLEKQLKKAEILLDMIHESSYEVGIIEKITKYKEGRR